MKTCRKAQHSYEATLKCCPTCRRENDRNWYEVNKERARENMRIWNKANSENLRDYHRDWKTANAERVRNYKRDYEANRRKTDPLFKLTKNIRALIISSFKRKGWKKILKLKP